MDLARQIPPGETYKLGIELLSFAQKVENILRTNASDDMEVKTFQVSQHSFDIKEKRHSRKNESVEREGRIKRPRD